MHGARYKNDEGNRGSYSKSTPLFEPISNLNFFINFPLVTFTLQTLNSVSSVNSFSCHFMRVSRVSTQLENPQSSPSFNSMGAWTRHCAQ